MIDIFKKFYCDEFYSSDKCKLTFCVDCDVEQIIIDFFDTTYIIESDILSDTAIVEIYNKQIKSHNENYQVYLKNVFDFINVRVLNFAN